MNSFDVLPPTANELEELKRARQQKLNPSITEFGKNRLEYLADIRRIFRDVKINDVVFSLGTLKSKELHEVYLATTKTTNNIEELLAYKHHSLAYSISKINHQNLDTLGVYTLSDRLGLIDCLEDSIVSCLFNSYETLKDEANAQFSVNNDNDMMVMAEDLKKLVKDPEHRFLWHICKMRGKMPDEIDLDELNPIMLAWAKYSWSEDYADEWKLLENNSYLTASFMNPEGVQKAMGAGSETYGATDAEFEATSRMLQEASRREQELQPRRRRRNIQ
jgi:hypothetical protein